MNTLHLPHRGKVSKSSIKIPRLLILSHVSGSFSHKYLVFFKNKQSCSDLRWKQYLRQPEALEYTMKSFYSIGNVRIGDEVNKVLSF